MRYSVLTPMVLEILRAARRLDHTLEKAVGRPYRIIITVGLITEISIQVREMLHAHFIRADFIQTAIWILLALLLVINQLGELSSRLDERPPRHMGRRRS
ncbi:MAG: hypothetical protein WBD67_11540 [Terracidiphilus sp.]